jgi:hypothetical protein
MNSSLSSGPDFLGFQFNSDKIVTDFAPLHERVVALDSQIVSSDYISLEDESGEAMLAALGRRHADGAR